MHHFLQAQLDDITARSAAAHREYQASLQELQHTLQSTRDQAATANGEWQQYKQQLDQEVQQLQVRHLLDFMLSHEERKITLQAAEEGSTSEYCNL